MATFAINEVDMVQLYIDMDGYLLHERYKDEHHHPQIYKRDMNDNLHI